MAAHQTLYFGRFRLQPEAHMLCEGERRVRLGSAALAILLALVRSGLGVPVATVIRRPDGRSDHLGAEPKRGIRSPRRWRKLHLGVDADTHEVVAVELTQDDVGNVSEIVGLLDQVATRVASVIADGAYDGEIVHDAVTDRHPEAVIIIPPRATAIPTTSGATQRDQHIATIEKHGRIGWQRRPGYNRPSLVETAMYRYKTIIGRRLYARILSGRRVEAKIGCNALNRMVSFGMPATIRIG